MDSSTTFTPDGGLVMFAVPGRPFRSKFPGHCHFGCRIQKGDTICYVAKGVVAHHDCVTRALVPPAYDPVLGPEEALPW